MSPSIRSNSRPPLTSRIRASFEGKRTKPEITSPGLANGNGYAVQDPETLQTAVDQAINGEAFQTAIAANLARLIKPSIKDALDTLQPVVEAVYSHEVLLRKTNRSVEDILIRLDTGDKIGRAGAETPTPTSPGTPTSPRRRNSNESSNSQDIEQFKQSLEKNNKRTVATLAELSSAVQANNKKIGEVAMSIGDIQIALASTTKNVDAVKTFVDQSPSTTAVLQAQLSQLGLVVDAVGSDLGSMVKTIDQKVEEHPTLLASHATKLDAISTDIIALKGQSGVQDTVQSLSKDLEALKGKVDGSITSNSDSFGALESQISSVHNAIEAHSGALAEIKDTNANPEVLAALRKSNDSHASHTALLGEIKDRSLALDSEPTPVPSAGDPESTALLQALQADLVVIKENVEAGLSSNSNGLADITSKVDSVLAAVEEHKSKDQGADILAAVQKSNDSHASHTETLEGIKSFDNAAPASNYDSNFAALEAQLASLQTSLQSHASALEDIKQTNTSTSKDLVPIPEDSTAMTLHTDITGIVNTLQSHNEVLNEIKEDISAEILSTLHDIAQSQVNSSAILSEIKEADVSAEILTALHSSNDSHASHTDSLEQLQAAVQTSNDSHAAHTTAFDELKSTRDVEPAAPSEATTPNALEANISALAATLEENKATLAEIKEAANTSNESHVAHAASLEGLKSARSIGENPAENGNLEGLESQIKAISATLGEHTSTFSAIHEAAKAYNESHAAHTAALAEIKEATGSLAESHATHGTTLSEIKDATAASNESHAAHTASLTELKSTQPQETSPRGDPTSTDVPALEEHLITIISNLETQKDALNDIKNAASNPELLDAVKETHGLVTSNHVLLTSHTSLLESVKAGASNDDIVSNIAELKAAVEQSKTDADTHSTLVKGLHTDTKNSHSELTQAIGALALGGAAGAGAAALASHDEDNTSSEILSEVKAVRALVETSSASTDATKETVSSLASQIDINHTTVTTSITTLSDELKAEIDATGTQIADSVKGLNGTIEAIDVSTLNSTVEGCSKDVKDLAGSIEALGGHVQTTGGKVDGLADGVHFNEKGLGQLTEHAIITDKAAPISEGAWFKNSSLPVAREVIISDPEDAEEKEHHYLSPVPEEQSPTQEETVLPEEPAVEDEVAVEEDPVPEEPAVEEEPVVEEEPTVEEPVVEEPVAEEPVPEEPAAEEPVAEEPVAEEPVAEEPAAEEPAAEPVIEEPLAEEKPAAEEEPAVEEPVVEEPVVEEPAAEELVAEEPATGDEPAVEEPVAEETVVEEPLAEEQPVMEEEPPAEEAVVKEAVADEPAVEETAPAETPTTDQTSEPAIVEHDPEEEENALQIPEAPVTNTSDLGEQSAPEAQSSSEAVETENTLDSEEAELESLSASTSALASPSSPAFESGKKGKKGKKEKKEKKEKKTEKEKVQFVMDGENPDE